MRAAGSRATAAVNAARAGEGMIWAPEELLAAQASLREAQAAHRVEESQLWPVPDATRVIDEYARAEHAGDRALAISTERRRVAIDGANAALREANGAVEASASLASTIHLGSQRRALLARAHLTLSEARVYHRQQDYGAATSHARQAEALALQVRDHAAEVAARYADAETVDRWRGWKQQTIEWSRREGRPAIIVSKEDHVLTLIVRGKPSKTYRADMGLNWIADKSQAGDGATPEGRYRITARKASGATIYHKALLLDYPNAEDRARFTRARRSGEVAASAGIGSLIEIHGEGGRGRDWTRGCVALTNADIDDLFARVDVGTPVTIIGSDDYGPIAGLAAQRRDPGAQHQP